VEPLGLSGRSGTAILHTAEEFLPDTPILSLSNRYPGFGASVGKLCHECAEAAVASDAAHVGSCSGMANTSTPRPSTVERTSTSIPALNQRGNRECRLPVLGKFRMLAYKAGLRRAHHSV
jgi:hypothetical protein